MPVQDSTRPVDVRLDEWSRLERRCTPDIRCLSLVVDEPDEVAGRIIGNRIDPPLIDPLVPIPIDLEAVQFQDLFQPQFPDIAFGSGGPGRSGPGRGDPSWTTG